MEKRRNPTLAQVAKLAGVSRTTASNALGAPGRISEETRERVRRVATEIGYKPHTGARNLRSGKAGAVVSLTEPASINGDGRRPRHFYAMVIESLTRGLAAGGYALVIVAREDSDLLDSIECDAILAYGDSDGVITADDLPSDVPLLGVAVAEPTEGLAARLFFDYTAMMESCVQHLFTQGSSKIGFMLCEQMVGHTGSLRQAFISACQRAGVEYRVAEPRSGREFDILLTELIDDGFDGLLIRGDDEREALKDALSIVHAANKRVPADVLLMSWSEGGRGESRLDPPVSCLSSLGLETGAVIAKAVVDGLRTGEFSDVVFPFELIVRRSTQR